MKWLLRASADPQVPAPKRMKVDTESKPYTFPGISQSEHVLDGTRRDMIVIQVQEGKKHIVQELLSDRNPVEHEHQSAQQAHQGEKHVVQGLLSGPQLVEREHRSGQRDWLRQVLTEPSVGPSHRTPTQMPGKSLQNCLRIGKMISKYKTDVLATPQHVPMHQFSGQSSQSLVPEIHAVPRSNEGMKTISARM